MSAANRTTREWYAQKVEERGALRIHVKVPSDSKDDCFTSDGNRRCSLFKDDVACAQTNKLNDGAHACWRLSARCPDGGVWADVV